MSGEHRAPGQLFRAPGGRAGQPDGRHTAEYVARNGVGIVGMYPAGAAGRVSLAEHLADPNPDRGGRFDPLPGRQDMTHHRPEYVPVEAHYVNPPGAPPRARRAVITTAALLVAIAAAAVTFTLCTGWLASQPPQPAIMVTPSTYGPPPTGGR